MSRTPSRHRVSARTPFAAALLALFGAAGQSAWADTIVVTNCADSGAGSLRQAVADANEGDTVDLSQLACSTISLTTGEIVVEQQYLTLSAYGAGAPPTRVDGKLPTPPLRIDAQGYGRVLHHTGSGTLSIVALALRNGNVVKANGGCLLSAGAVALSYSTVSYCQAVAMTDSSGRNGGCGGGLSAYAVTIDHSAITHNRTLGVSPSGGGICANRELHLRHSLVSDNSAYAKLIAPLGSGGGISFGVLQTSDISYSTIADNFAATGGGVDTAVFSGHNLSILSSTISGNRVYANGSGILVESGLIGIYNSTVTANTSQRTGAGVYLATNAVVVSSIIAGNVAQGAPSDLNSNSKQQLLGSNNIIPASSISLPPGTILDDPELAPLADNGGPTPTHALLAGSPAIDQGTNPFGERCDQRYFAHDCYPRQIGTATDIGAFEFGAQRDAIFDNGFE